MNHIFHIYLVLLSPTLEYKFQEVKIWFNFLSSLSSAPRRVLGTQCGLVVIHGRMKGSRIQGEICKWNKGDKKKIHFWYLHFIWEEITITSKNHPNNKENHKYRIEFRNPNSSVLVISHRKMVT